MEQFEEILRKATAAVGPEYFLLPIHGGDPIYRERVYCYELYHQMRLLWPAESPYRLNGEIDKSRHPYFKYDGGKPKPDFLVHILGNDKNYAVVEVKSSRGRSNEIRKDLKTLCQFRKLGYKRAIYLVYSANSAKTMLVRIEKEYRLLTDVSVPIEVWLHSEVNAVAICSFILNPKEDSPAGNGDIPVRNEHAGP